MVTFSEIIPQIVSNPVLAVIMALVAGAIFVNGATDASNAITPAISTRSIRPEVAIVMGAICNFAGLIVMTSISTAVADTIGGMVDFGTDAHAALVALAAAMVSIIAWGGVAWAFGIPTSQSHSLIAGLTGAAIAVQGGMAGVNLQAWLMVIYGLLLSTALGFVSGLAVAKIIQVTCANASRPKANRAFGALQVLSAAVLAFMHGAQDGQKFMSVAMLGVTLALGGASGRVERYPMWIMVFCAACMALGTALGGKKIIAAVGRDMVRMEKYQGFAASAAASGCLLLASLTGVPVSTTHTNTTAVMGAGAARRMSSVKWGIVGNMVLTWVFTFPGCGLIGFGLAKAFLLLA